MLFQLLQILNQSGLHNCIEELAYEDESIKERYTFWCLPFVR